MIKMPNFIFVYFQSIFSTVKYFGKIYIVEQMYIFQNKNINKI